MDAVGYTRFFPPIEPGHPLWLSAANSTPLSGIEHPAEPRFRCTREVHHEGERHAAHGPGNEVFASWPSDIRYPVTYALDLIRYRGGYGENGVKLSRSEASAVLS